MIIMSRWGTTVAALAAGVLAVGCTGGRTSASDSPLGARRLRVVAAFYPLAFVAQRVGAGRVKVKSVSKPGAEPHDVELTARDVAAVQDADLVLYLAHFQPAVDTALRGRERRVLDVGAATSVDLKIGGKTGAGAVQDPHFWLDPMSLARVGDAVADRLAAVDPGAATTYRSNAAALRADLTRVDADFRAGLQTCNGRAIVTTHTAFAYLARAYGLTQVGIAGNDPEAEPTSTDQAGAIDFARTHNVRTIFTEPLVSSDIARTVANEIGGTTAVLDPIESIGKASKGGDYIEVMRSNLVALQAGLGCR